MEESDDSDTVENVEATNELVTLLRKKIRSLETSETRLVPFRSNGRIDLRKVQYDPH